MAKTITTPYDVADYLRTPEERAGYLQAIIEEFEGDPKYVMEALSDIARSEGMTHVSRKAKVSRESLYKSLSGKRNPGFATIMKVMTALGLQFRVTAIPHKEPEVASVSPATRTTRTKRAASPLKKPVNKPSNKRTSLKTPRTKSRTVAKATRST